MASRPSHLLPVVVAAAIAVAAVIALVLLLVQSLGV